MNEMQSGILDIIQMMTMVQSRPSNKADKAEDDSFRKLMEEHSKPAKKDDAQTKDVQDKEQEGAEQPEAVQPPKDSEAEQQERMTLAAMAMMQAPVVPVEVKDGKVIVPQTAAPVQQVAQATGEHAAEAVAPVAQEDPQAGEAQQQILTEAQPKAEQEQAAEAKVEHAPEFRQQVREAAPEHRAPAAEHETQDMEIEVNTAAEPQQTLFRDVEAAPVKVGEAPAMEETAETEGVDKQLSSQLTKALAQGESKVEIQLTPAYLGSVKIEVTRSADGGLHVLLSADSTRTQNLLDKHAAGLQSLMMNQSQDNVRVEVQHSQENQQHNAQYQEGSGHNGQQQEQHQRQTRQDSQDFLQQLRLGLIPMDGETA